MKKRVNTKKKKSKVTKTKASEASIAVEQDIAVLLTTLVQRLASFEVKIDAVLKRVMSQPLEAPRQQQQQVTTSLATRRIESRNTHKAICADCSRDCEVPFKPSGNRPVYCRECFALRKNKGVFKPREESKPKEVPALSIRSSEKLKVKKTANSPKKRKSVTKKKKKKATASPKKKKTVVKKKKKASKRK